MSTTGHYLLKWPRYSYTLIIKTVENKISNISFISLRLIGYFCLKQRGWRMVTNYSNAIMRDKNPVVHMIHDNFTVSNKSFIVELRFRYWTVWIVHETMFTSFDFSGSIHDQTVSFIHGPSTDRVQWTIHQIWNRKVQTTYICIPVGSFGIFSIISELNQK